MKNQIENITSRINEIYEKKFPRIAILEVPDHWGPPAYSGQYANRVPRFVDLTKAEADKILASNPNATLITKEEILEMEKELDARALEEEQAQTVSKNFK